MHKFESISTYRANETAFKNANIVWQPWIDKATASAETYADDRPRIENSSRALR